MPLMHCIVHFRMILNRSDNLCARFVSFGNVCVLLMLLDRSNRVRGWLEEAAESVCMYACLNLDEHGE